MIILATEENFRIPGEIDRVFLEPGVDKVLHIPLISYAARITFIANSRLFVDSASWTFALVWTKTSLRVSAATI